MKIGCDIVQIKRVQKASQKEGFLRILTKEEKSIYETLEKHRQVEWLAGRFAAKEAIIKAISFYEPYVLSQISIVYENNRPSCKIKGYQIEVSIAHENDYVIAYAIVERSES